MIKKKGFGDFSSKKVEDLETVKNLMQIGKIKKAEEILLSLKERKKLDHVGLHLLATIYKFKSEYSLALNLLLQSIKLEPLYVEAYSDIGAIYIENNNFS